MFARLGRYTGKQPIIKSVGSGLENILWSCFTLEIDVCRARALLHCWQDLQIFCGNKKHLQNGLPFIMHTTEPISKTVGCTNKCQSLKLGFGHASALYDRTYVKRSYSQGQVQAIKSEFQLNNCKVWKIFLARTKSSSVLDECRSSIFPLMSSTVLVWC